MTSAVMFRFAMRAALPLFVAGLVLETSTWGPADSVHALDGVITAVNTIVHNPHLSAEQLTKAKKMAEDIKADVEAVEAGHLSKQQTKEKIGSAIKELSSFSAQMSTVQASTSTDDKLKMLTEKLAEKKKALAKVENMMKLLKLKKALAEKKLLLENMLAKKSKAKNGDADAAAVGKEVNDMLAMAKSITAKSGDASASFKTIEAKLQAREKVVSDSLNRIVAEQKKGDAQIDAILKNEGSQDSSGKSDFDVKKQKMFKHLKAEENRKFAKAKAMKQNQLKELKAAEKDTEAKNVGALIDTLSKMQRENRQLQAKSGDFLH